MKSQKLDFYAFVTDLDKKGLLAEYAENVGTSVSYIKKHLIYRRKVPRQKLLYALVAHSNNEFSYTQLINWFHKVDESYLPVIEKNMIKNKDSKHANA